MRKQAGELFRILGPDPMEFSRHPLWKPTLALRIQFKSRQKSISFRDRISGFAGIHSLEFRKEKKQFALEWKIDSGDLPVLARHLKTLAPGWADLSAQIHQSWKGYSAGSHGMIRGRGKQVFRWNRRTQVMGVLNITPDSFSDGGRYLDPRRAADQALQMQEDGADWIDVGGESTRPGARPVSAAEEKNRVLPVLRACAKAVRIPLSIDTYKAGVAEAAVGEGARLVNDIGALSLDPAMAKTLARLKTPVILMHMRGKPRTMQKNPRYDDVIGELIAFFRERIRFAQENGIEEDRILIDPGFGFGKGPWHNLEILRRLWEFKIFGRPLVLGPSRKSTLGNLLGGVPPAERLDATLAAVTTAVLKGADLIRVHDVKNAVRAVKIADAVRYDRGLERP